MKVSDKTMATRLSLQSEFRHEPDEHEHGDNYKRNAWLVLFGSSFLFWVLVVAMVWTLWS